MRHMRSYLLVVTVFGLVVAACGGTPATTAAGGDQAGAADTTEAADQTSIPSETTSPATTSTIIVPTTSTGVATTTTATPNADTFLIAGNTCLLGWWDGDWTSTGVPPVVGGEEYQVVRLDEPVSTATGSEPRPWCEPLDLKNIEFEPPLPGAFLDLDAVAVQTSSDIRPHGVEVLGTAPDAYLEATSELLAGRVAAVPVINITQVIRTDLEGDGVEEVIVAASTIPDDFVSTVVSDYSILYVRKLIDGEVETAILGLTIIGDPDDLLQGVVVYEVAAIADLNGDGKMEIVVNGTVWEGAFLQAFEWVNDDLGLVEVLSCGCGS